LADVEVHCASRGIYHQEGGVMKSVDQIKAILESMQPDIEKLEMKGVKAAAPRVRKALMDISKACKEGRKEALEIRDRI
jgi:hypothetical protein